jgi:hypothetical protein
MISYELSLTLSVAGVLMIGMASLAQIVPRSKAWLGFIPDGIFSAARGVSGLRMQRRR